MPTLVIQTAFLGDVVLTTPLLSALAALHGPVDVVTTPVAAPLLETHPAVRTVIPYDKRGTDGGWGGGSPRHRWAVRCDRPRIDLGQQAVALFRRAGPATHRSCSRRCGWGTGRCRFGRGDPKGGGGRRRAAKGRQCLWKIDPAPIRRADRAGQCAGYQRQRASASGDRDGHAGRSVVWSDRDRVRVWSASPWRCGIWNRQPAVPALLIAWSAALPAGPSPLYARAHCCGRVRGHRGTWCVTSSGLTSGGRIWSQASSLRTAPRFTASCRSRRWRRRAQTSSPRAS